MNHLCALAVMLFMSASPAAVPPPIGLTPEQAAALADTLGLPPGSRVTLKYRESTTTETGEGAGAGASASGQKLDAGFTGSPPSVVAGGLSGTGGGSTQQTMATGWTPPASLWRNPLLWLGVLFLLAAGGCVYLGLKRCGTILGVTGGALIAGAIWPTLSIFAALGAVVVIAAPYVVTEIQKRKLGVDAHRKKESLRGVAEGVYDFSRAEPEAYERLKPYLSAKMDEADKAVIKEIKEADGLGQ